MCAQDGALVYPRIELSCQQAFEVGGELVRWATNVNIKILTDQELVTFWEDVSQKLRELMDKALFFRRAIDNCTQHRICELHHKHLQFKRGVCTCGKKPTFKTVIEHSSKSPPPLALTLAGS